MVEVEFMGPIARESLRLEVSNLKDLKAILSNDASLNEWLKICAVALNDKIIFSLETPLKSGDKVTLLPPVCGG